MTALPIALLLILVITGCTALKNVAAGGSPSIWHPVWMPDGWIYFMREINSDGIEVWRQRDGENAATRVLNVGELEASCNGSAAFLFRATDTEVGIGVECPEVNHVELVAYSPMNDSFRPLAITPFITGLALRGDSISGYAELGTDCGSTIVPILNGKVEGLSHAVTVNGRAWLPQGLTQSDCEGTVPARSPVLTRDNDLLFVAAPEGIGDGPDGVHNASWVLASWDGKSSTARTITSLNGLADLAALPGRHTIIAAVSSPGGGVWMIDTTTGKKKSIVDSHKAYHPSISPDGSRFVYVEELSELYFESVP